MSFVSRDLIVSCSVDQRVALWRVAEGKIRLERQLVVDVADIQSHAMWWRDTREEEEASGGEDSCEVAVAGQGMAVVQAVIQTEENL